MAKTDEQWEALRKVTNYAITIKTSAIEGHYYSNEASLEARFKRIEEWAEQLIEELKKL